MAAAGHLPATRLAGREGPPPATRPPGHKAPPPVTRPPAREAPPARLARAPKGLGVLRTLAALALVLALGGCAVPSARPSDPGAIAPAPGSAPSAGMDGAAGGRAAGSPDGSAAQESMGGPGGRALDPAGPKPGVDVPGTPPEAPGFEVAEAPRHVTVPGPASPPVRLTIPAIGVATPLVRLGRERDGSMQVPTDFARAGWFAEGPTPGQVGPAVIAGHVDSKTGPAVFYRLRELRAGDTVQVERADGARLRFVIEQTRSFPKASFPTAEVFGPAPWAALRLVTCGGTFDRARGSYRDNLVVFARLAGVSR
jgi:Sortase domain